MQLHVDLEEALARFKGVEATISFQSGFAANLGTIPALADEGDVIISDSLNHASIVDGVRLARAGRSIYPTAMSPHSATSCQRRDPRGRGASW